MPRIPLYTDPAELNAAGRDAWDFIASSRGRIVGPYAALLHSPELAKRIAHTGTYVRFESTLPGDLRELAIISVARCLDCRFEWAAHVVIAREEGLREEVIEAVRNRSTEGLEPVEANIFDYTRQLLVDHRPDDAIVTALQDHFGTQGLVDLTGTIGFYSMIAATLNGFDINPGPEADQLPV